MVIAARDTDPQLDALVAAIVERVRPELVLLLGSRARGDAHADSDYDLMLVVREGQDAESSREAANEVCSSMKLPVDVLARTTSEYQRRQNDPGFLDWLVAREGRLLYSSGNIPQRSPRSDRVREQSTDGVALWIERSESDFQVAINSLASTKPSWDAICFHAHACVEKLLKALIVASGSYPPKTHWLGTLMAGLPANIRNGSDLKAIADVLDGLYPKSRYAEQPMPTPHETRRAFDAARGARDRLLKELRR